MLTACAQVVELGDSVFLTAFFLSFFFTPVNWHVDALDKDSSIKYSFDRASEGLSP